MKDKQDHRDHIERTLQDVFTGYTVEADDHVWSEIEEALHPKKKRRVFWWMQGVAASVTGLVVLGAVAATGFLAVFNVLDLSRPDGLGPGPGNEDVTIEMPAAENPTAAEDNPLENPADEHGLPTGETQETPAGERVAASHGQVPPPAFITQPKTQGPASEAPFTAYTEIQDLLKKMQGRGPHVSMSWAEPVIEKRVFPIDPSEYAVKKDPARRALVAHLGSGQKESDVSYGQLQSLYENRSDATYGFMYYGLSADDFIAEEVKYNPPVVFGLRTSFGLSKRLSFETGISYTRFPVVVTGKINGQEAVQRGSTTYLGLPLLFNYHFIHRPRVGVYCTQGILLDEGTTRWHDIEVINNSQSIPAVNRPQYFAPRAGLVSGLGADYRVNRLLSVYMQPSVTYWLTSIGSFDSQTKVLLWPNLQTGLRLNF